ncbi:MAG: HAMP domain-containing histidine kinase [Clostridiales Family XIII bacterium]|jgi:signal transduction histidine kinase|nr:HAMP domain-containing histidine kinase [Clostridiales Family XIII bacterium]
MNRVDGRNEKRQRHSKGQGIAFMLLFLLLLAGAFALSLGLSRWLFRLTGSPPEFVAYLIAAVLGFVLVAAASRLVWRISSRSNQIHDARHFMADIFAAIDRVAEGDFSVFVPTDEHPRSPFNELAESVNKMARELGTMEQLRQTFISDVSHEIQSPLTSISGFAALLRKEDVSREEVRHYAAIIETESRRLSKLSENLLKLSALEADAETFEMKLFRLDRQIQSVMLMLEPQWAAKNITPDMSLAPAGVDGNEDLLSQVWVNLLHNAVKFTPEGGAVGVTLTEEDGEIRCLITDNGIGIPKEDQPRIFERFYKADKSRDRALGGNGLGLSLVKKIVELHGGRVSVESGEEAGTTFTVRLPARK